MSVLPVEGATAALWPSSAAGQAGPSLPQAGVTDATAPTSPTSPLGSAGETTGAGGGFAGVLGAAMDGLQSTQAAADNLATQAATGSLTNVADYMVTAEEANIQTQLTAAVRNNALQAFQQIMGMPL
jgi:flagellar hook-basal body complex protein FliE